MDQKDKKGLNVASFFSGCGGFDLGFKKAGYNIVLASDKWEPAYNVYKKNFPDTKFILDDIKNINKETLRLVLKEKKIKKIDVVIGGPPCQCFTRLNNNNHEKRKMDDRNHLFKEYIRVIRILKPDFVVMENVADLISRKDERGIPFTDLISKAFNRAGYKVSYRIFKTEKYNVPQRRRRIIFIATSKNIEVTFPKESFKESIIKPFLERLSLQNKLTDHEITVNEPHVIKRIKHIPPGGYYENLPEELKVKKVRNGEFVTVKRYGSYYRRLNNEKPAATITNNYVIHPCEDRYLTNREKATLHTFPTNFIFEESLGATSQMIANAVPPEFARKIAIHLKKLYSHKP